MTDYLFSGEMREFLLNLREDLNIGGEDCGKICH